MIRSFTNTLGNVDINAEIAIARTEFLNECSAVLSALLEPPVMEFPSEKEPTREMAIAVISCGMAMNRDAFAYFLSALHSNIRGVELIISATQRAMTGKSDASEITAMLATATNTNQ